MRSFAKVYFVAILVAFAQAAWAYSVPEDQRDETRVLHGNLSSFDNPASVKMEDVIRATPEYAQIKKEKLERGSGKYWILIAQAQDRAKTAIDAIADDTDYDLIVEDGYLDNLKPPIPSVDITEDVLKELENEE